LRQCEVRDFSELRILNRVDFGGYPNVGDGGSIIGPLEDRGLVDFRFRLDLMEVGDVHVVILIVVIEDFFFIGHYNSITSALIWGLSLFV
jgi:hypothetical protein